MGAQMISENSPTNGIAKLIHPTAYRVQVFLLCNSLPIVFCVTTNIWWRTGDTNIAHWSYISDKGLGSAPVLWYKKIKRAVSFGTALFKFSESTTTYVADVEIDS